MLAMSTYERVGDVFASIFIHDFTFLVLPPTLQHYCYNEDSRVPEIPLVPMAAWPRVAFDTLAVFRPINSWNKIPPYVWCIYDKAFGVVALSSEFIRSGFFIHLHPITSKFNYAKTAGKIEQLEKNELM